jgi:hypothetical protein
MRQFSQLFVFLMLVLKLIIRSYPGPTKISAIVGCKEK